MKESYNHFRMISLLFLANLLLLFAVHPPPACAQGQGVCPNGAQPLATSLDPPSGTTGDDLRESTNYEVGGDLLDQVATVVVNSDFSLAAAITSRNSSSIRFHITPEANFRNGERENAMVSLIPVNRNCLTRNFTVTLFAVCE